MDLTESSDSEFWNEIDTNPRTKKSGVEKLSNSLMSVIKSKISKPIAEPAVVNLKSFDGREYYEDRLARVRESKDEEMREFSIITKNHIHREYEAAFEIIKNNFKTQITHLKSECTSLNETLQARDITINHLCQVISDMELHMAKAHLLAAKPSIQHKPAKELPSEFYLTQIYNLSLQVDSLKEICESYKKQIDSTKESNNALKDSHRKIQMGLRLEIDRLNDLIKKREAEFDKKMKGFQTEFDKYKTEINLEHQMKDVIVERQKGHIDDLKDELKNAKIVLQNRNLRMKFYEKLSDYMQDSETAAKHKKVRSEMPSRNASSKFRSTDPTKFTKKRVRRSEAASPNHTGVFSRKISTPNYFNVELNVL